VAVLGLAGAACGVDSVPSASTGAEPTASDDLLVFAAASLTDSYTELGRAFEADHPGTNLTFNFGSSSDLVNQVLQGARADVVASADEANMAKLTEAGATAGPPQVFATNTLQIIVEPGNPKRITELADLAQPDLLYVTAAPGVPIGRYSQQVLAAAGVTVSPVSLEENVKGIVTKVVLGEADAGIVYVTDVRAAGDAAQGVPIAANLNLIAAYPIAVPTTAANPARAQAFVDFVLSPPGQEILTGYGFTAP
jgi:molybdate transport system substrate-binding protein